MGFAARNPSYRPLRPHLGVDKDVSEPPPYAAVAVARGDSQEARMKLLITTTAALFFAAAAAAIAATAPSAPRASVESAAPPAQSFNSTSRGGAASARRTSATAAPAATAAAKLRDWHTCITSRGQLGVPAHGPLMRQEPRSTSAPLLDVMMSSQAFSDCWVLQWGPSWTSQPETSIITCCSLLEARGVRSHRPGAPGRGRARSLPGRGLSSAA